MKTLARPMTAIIAVVIAFSGLVAGAPARLPLAAAAEGNAVTDWSLIAQNAWSVGRPGTSGMYVAALVHAAIYDAVVAIDGGGEPFISSPTVGDGANPDAAVAAAARDILVARVPSQAGSVQDQYTAYLAAIQDGPAKANGIAVGQAAAAAVLANREGDGLDNVVPWVSPPPGPGVFEPQPAGSTPVEVKIGQIKPIALRSATQFRAPPPVSLRSAEYAADLAEVQLLGGAEGSPRTSDQTTQARFWAENPFVQWTRTLRDLAIARGMSRSESARFLALVHVANVDALITCFESKYHYLYWRPMHAIQRADTDGNPATAPDPGWTPLLVVNHPEYPSGHGCASGAVLEAMARFFGNANVALTISSTVTGTSRTYANLHAVNRDIFMARIYGGLHFRSTMAAGFNLGKHVGRYVARNNFAATD